MLQSSILTPFDPADNAESSEDEIDTSDPWFKEAMDDVVLESAETAKPKCKLADTAVSFLHNDY
jgi:hypothetical protein